MDFILIKNLDIFAYHGVNSEENILGQHFLIDVKIFVNREKNNFLDDINSTINISAIKNLITEVTTSNTYKLIETLAEKICKEIILKYELALKVEIEVKKPQAPLKNSYFDYVSINLSRKRSDYIG